MKKFLKYLTVFIVLMIVFVSLLVISCSFPSSLIKKNVASSSKTLNKEGNRKVCFIINKLQYQQFDNYSDSLMINTAYSIDSKTPMYSAFTAKKDYIPGVTKKIFEDKVGELSSNSKYKYHDEVSELEDTVNGEGEESFEYAKYWHGYLTVLRPLLLLLDYQQIRVFLTMIFAILAILVTTEIAEKKSKVIASFYLLSLLGIEYFYIGLSLINSIMFMIMMIASLIIVKRFDKIKDFGLLFFIIGMCTSFFGLLDAPLLTLGGPLILYFIYKDKDGEGDFKDLVKFSVLWLLGYGLTWLLKWLLIDFIYHRDLIKTAFGQIMYRSVGMKNSSIISICLNLLLMSIPIMINVIIMVFLMIKYLKNLNKDNFKRGRIFLIISIIPILWYIILANHSQNHYFFTYRLLFISIFSNLVGIYYIVRKPER